MIFRLYTVYNKHEIIKIGNQTIEKYQVLSQVLKIFCWRLGMNVVMSSHPLDN